MARWTPCYTVGHVLKPLTVGSATAIVIGIAVAAWVAVPSQGPESATPPHPAVTTDAEVSHDSRSPVRAELLSEVEIIQPGTVFRLGVELEVEPGWHVVATGPDEEDDARTTVDFSLPDGYQAGPARWPAPVSFTRPDGTVLRGYRDRVVMYREVRASNLDPDHEWHLSARVNWLALRAGMRARRCDGGVMAAVLDLGHSPAELEKHPPLRRLVVPARGRAAVALGHSRPAEHTQNARRIWIRGPMRSGPDPRGANR